MEYRNVKTGFVFLSNDKLSGENWEIIDGKKKPVTCKDEKPIKTKETVEIEDIGVTVKEIKQELDALGIEYDPKAKKQELYDLMMSQGK